MDSSASAMSARAAHALAAAVIVRAIQDFRRVGERSRPAAWASSRLIQAEARAFLTAERGPWAQARADWCTIADVDPDQLRRLVVSGRLEGAAELFRALRGRPAGTDGGKGAANG